MDVEPSRLCKSAAYVVAVTAQLVSYVYLVSDDDVE